MTHSNAGTILNQGSTINILGDSFTNEVGGILTGNGVFDFTDTGMLNDGIVAPGLSAGQIEMRGDIEFTASSDLQIELGGILSSEFDWISITDSLVLDGGLSVSFIDGFHNSILSTDVFTIVDSASTIGTFSGLADGDRFNTIDGRGSFQINYAGNNVVLGNFTPVPEPGSLVLLTGLAIVAVGRRRRPGC
jgi:hypothetical protein